MNLQQARNALKKGTPLFLTLKGKYGTDLYLITSEDDLKNAVCATVEDRKDWYTSPTVLEQHDFAQRALRGDHVAAYWLLDARSDYEYEGFEVTEATRPKPWKPKS